MKKAPTSASSSSSNGKVVSSSSNLVAISDLLPPQLHLIPVAQATFFPHMVVPLILPEGKLSRAVDNVMENGGYLGVILSRHHQDGALGQSPNTSMTGLPAEGSVASGVAVDGKRWTDRDFFRYGVAAKVIKKINLPDNQISVLLSGLQRFQIEEVTEREPHFIAQVKYLYEHIQRDTELEAMVRTSLSQFKQISKDNPLVSEEVKVALVNIDGPGKLADFMASVLIRDVRDYQRFLASNDVKDRYQQLLVMLKRELEVQSMQKKFRTTSTRRSLPTKKNFICRNN